MILPYFLQNKTIYSILSLYPMFTLTNWKHDCLFLNTAHVFLFSVNYLTLSIQLQCLQKFRYNLSARFQYQLLFERYPGRWRYQTTIAGATTKSECRVYTQQRTALRHVPANIGCEEIRASTSFQRFIGKSINFFF